jgi:hypothetical protein
MLQELEGFTYATALDLNMGDMMSLGTDFEMHAIWQGYIEEPDAKDFVVRKARTIALSKVQGT